MYTLLILKLAQYTFSLISEFAYPLIRFRLDIQIGNLGYRFKTLSATISKCVLKWLDILFVQLKPLIIWPSGEVLVETTPMCFRQHFKIKVVVVVDCFEVFCHQPRNMGAQAETFTSYKHSEIFDRNYTPRRC